MSATIRYNGSVIATVAAGESKILECAEKKMASNVSVELPEGYVIPEGTVSITENGTHDVTAFANAEVDVPIPDGYIQPSGTLTITENGTHDVSGYASAEVNVEAESSGLAINGIIEQYKVNAGATVNAGDFVEFVNKLGGGTFASSNVTYVSAVMLDDSRIFVAYKETDATYSVGTAVVLTIDGGNITAGAPVAFNGNTYGLSVTPVSSNKVLVTYNWYSGSANEAVALVLTIDGTNVAVGASVKLYSGHMTVPRAVALSSSKVLVTNYCLRGQAVILTINGTSIEMGTDVTYGASAWTGDKYPVALTDSKVLVAYNAGDSLSGTGEAVILTVNDTDITVGTAVQFYSSPPTNVTTVVLSDSKVLVTYGNQQAYAMAVVLTVEDTAITVGARVTLKSSSTGNTSAVALTDSEVLFAYSDGNNSSKGTAVVLTISGTNVVAQTPVVFESNAVRYTSLVAFSETLAFVFYNNGAGAFSALTIDGTTITANSESGTFVQPATSRLHNVGVAATSGAEGETVDVYVVG